MAFSEPQLAVYTCPNRFRVLITGRRFGKTHLAMYELLRFASRKPNSKIFYVAPTYRMSKEIMWKPLKKKVTCGYFSVSALRNCFKPNFEMYSPNELFTDVCLKITDDFLSFWSY